MTSTSPMKEFYGTKKIRAIPMTRGAYNQYRGWELPENENAHDDGYLVEYLDGGKGNDDRHTGYISWSPTEAFDNAYQPMTGLSFGHAIEAMKDGKKVGRAGWNGKGMFIVLMSALYLPPFNTQGTDRKVNDRTAKWIGEDKPLDSQPYFSMFTALGQWQPGWLASQADMLANDWQVLE